MNKKNIPEEEDYDEFDSLEDLMTDLSKGKKDDQGKLRYDLIPPVALEELVKIYTHGAAKYGDHNWEKGLSWSRVFGAIMRHLWAFWKGEDYDPESELSHVAHAAWGCFTLLTYMKEHRKLDDRSKK
jgi:hypothetical protein